MAKLFKMPDTLKNVLSRIPDEHERIEFAKMAIANPLKFFCPNLVQEKIIKEVSDAYEESPVSTTIITAGNNTGKCLKLDAPILYPDGSFKKLEDVKIGDIVVVQDYTTGNTETGKIIRTIRSGIKKIYRANFEDGGFVEASFEHEFPIKFKDTRMTAQKTSLYDINQLGYLGGSDALESEVYFQSLHHHKRNKNRLLKNVEYVGDFECGDLEVDHPSHTYVSYDYIVTGNSTSILHIVANLVYGKQNGWFDYPMFENFKFPHKITLITTPSNIENNFFSTADDIPSFVSLLKNKDIEFLKKGKTHVKHVDFKHDGWEMNVFTYNQDATEIESFTTGVVIFDEPAPEPLFRAMMSRVRRGAIIMMPMTPLSASPYILDEVINKAEANIKGYRSIVGDARTVLTSQTRGHFDDAIAMAQFEKYSDDEFDARVKGELQYYKERILDTFNPKVHVASFLEYPLQEDYLYFHAIDPGDGKPNAEIWGCYTPEGRKIIFYEAPEDSTERFWNMKGTTTVKQHILQTIHIESKLMKKYGFRMDFTRIIDYHFADQRRGENKRNLWEAYEDEARKLGVTFDLESSYKTVFNGSQIDYGHRMIKELFQFLPDGKPGLIIYENCQHMINGIVSYIRKPPRTENELNMPAKLRQIVLKFKDFVDVLRYFVCADERISKEIDYTDYDAMITSDSANAFK